MKFPYLRYGHILMPIIPLVVRIGDIRMATEALVDSGASCSVFDAQFARALGIKNVQKDGMIVDFEGVSGHSVRGYVHTVTLEMGGRRFPNIPIAFSNDMPDNAVNILGQEGFFELCPILFTFAKKEVELLAE